MLELYSSLSSAFIMGFMMLSVFAVIIQTMYFSRVQGHMILKVFEGFNVGYLILLSLILRTINEALNASIILVGIYDIYRWVMGILIIIAGITAYIITKQPHILYGLAISLLTNPSMEKLPYGGYTLCFCVSLLFFACRAYILCKAECKKQRTKITENSIKEAMDTQHSGVLFAETNGNILLTNTQMLSLMKQLAGKHQRNAKSFWMTLIDTASFNTDCRSTDDCCVKQIADGKFWQFRRNRISRKGKEIYQIIATDVTEQVAINQKLQYYQTQLEEQREQLKDVLNNIEELRKQEALNRTWSYIHDLLGQRISILQRVLRSELSLNSADTASLIDRLLEDITIPQEISPDKIYEELVSYFAALSVHLHKEGNLPSDEAMARTFVGIIREGVTNAVRHGQAQNIYIKLNESEDCVLTITNDGIPSPETIYWGEGLKGINRKAKELGCILQIQTRPEFKLMMNFK